MLVTGGEESEMNQSEFVGFGVGKARERLNFERAFHATSRLRGDSAETAEVGSCAPVSLVALTVEGTWREARARRMVIR